MAIVSLSPVSRVINPIVFGVSNEYASTANPRQRSLQDLLKLDLFDPNWLEYHQKPIGSNIAPVRLGVISNEDLASLPGKTVTFHRQIQQGSNRVRTSEVLKGVIDRAQQTTYGQLSDTQAQGAGYANVQALKDTLTRAYGKIHPDYPVIVASGKKTS
jgi:hypothetical protein